MDWIAQCTQKGTYPLDWVSAFLSCLLESLDNRTEAGTSISGENSTKDEKQAILKILFISYMKTETQSTHFVHPFVSYIRYASKELSHAPSPQTLF